MRVFFFSGLLVGEMGGLEISKWEREGAVCVSQSYSIK